MKKFIMIPVFIGVICLLILNCAKNETPVLKMATTTSTDNTGLLDYLKPHIKSGTGIDMQWVAVGTGRALELGKNCDVDLLFVHDPSAEEQFVKGGYGVNRTRVMYNDFIIIGPESDPGKIKTRSVNDSFKAIAKGGFKFASRGDNSGTYEKERDLWKSAGIKIPEKEKWYIQTGQGMINTINIAAEMDAYTLTDRGTYIKYEAGYKGKPPLVILIEGEESLKNQYSVISVNTEKCGETKHELSRKITEWMISSEGQKLIGGFKLLDKQLFIPNAGK